MMCRTNEPLTSLNYTHILRFYFLISIGGTISFGIIHEVAFDTLRVEDHLISKYTDKFIFLINTDVACFLFYNTHPSLD